MCTRVWYPAGGPGTTPAKGDTALRKEDSTIGGTYSAKVGARTLDVRIESENAKGGWNGTAVESGKPVRIKDARSIRGAAGTDGDRTVEPANEGEGESDAA